MENLGSKGLLNIIKDIKSSRLNNEEILAVIEFINTTYKNDIYKNITKYNFLSIAIKNNYVKVLKYIIKVGIDIDNQNSIEFENFNKLMFKAICKNRTKCLKVLINAKVNLNYQNHHGNSPLLAAANYNYINCLNVLIDAGANLNIRNNKGDTALHMVANNRNLKCLINLVKAGVNLNIRNNKGYTALHVLANNDCLECLIYLVNAGADLNICNNMGDTALHLAIEMYNTDCLTYLINVMSDLNIRNNLGKTALFIAIEFCDETVLKLLIEAGANIKICDNNNNTPLYDAVLYSYIECAKLLINSGANVNFCNNNNNTILYQLINFNLDNYNDNICDELIFMLLEAGANYDNCMRNKIVRSWVMLTDLNTIKQDILNIKEHLADIEMRPGIGQHYFEHKAKFESVLEKFSNLNSLD